MNMSAQKIIEENKQLREKLAENTKTLKELYEAGVITKRGVYRDLTQSPYCVVTDKKIYRFSSAKKLDIFDKMFKNNLYKYRSLRLTINDFDNWVRECTYNQMTKH